MTIAGWIFFSVLMAVHLAPDIINALKVLWTCIKGSSLSKEFARCFVGGLCLLLITALALYASVVYNIAIARSDTELITNAVIILFINDLDEQLYVLLGVICPGWLDSLNEKSETGPACTQQVNESKKSTDEASNTFAGRLDELERREKESREHPNQQRMAFEQQLAEMRLELKRKREEEKNTKSECSIGSAQEMNASKSDQDG